MLTFDTIVIGAGAAGFMAAITAAQYGQKTLLLDSSKKLCEKIRISGGGRCNFTNINANYQNYISQNTNFARSALSSYTPEDFIGLVEKHRIKFHEKKLGQLFCDESSQEIINLLKNEAHQAGVKTVHPIKIEKILVKEKNLELDLLKKESSELLQNLKRRFACIAKDFYVEANKLVIATGGLSIPKLGTSSFGYDLASLLDINVVKTEPGLVPLVLDDELLRENVGASFDVELMANQIKFRENILITHKGLSGPATLQISNYWQPKELIQVNLCPDLNLEDYLLKQKKKNQATKLSKIIAGLRQKKNIVTFTNKLDREFIFPKNFIRSLETKLSIDKNIQEYSQEHLKLVASEINSMELKPTNYEGFEKAEVTKGGVDTKDLDQKSLEAKNCKGLHFIGEVVDVTGWLGGYNFQWAWASGYAAGLS